MHLKMASARPFCQGLSVWLTPSQRWCCVVNETICINICIQKQNEVYHMCMNVYITQEKITLVVFTNVITVEILRAVMPCILGHEGIYRNYHMKHLWKNWDLPRISEYSDTRIRPHPVRTHCWWCNGYKSYIYKDYKPLCNILVRRCPMPLFI